MFVRELSGGGAYVTATGHKATTIRDGADQYVAELVRALGGRDTH